jgi:hypothetical protein
MIIAVLICAVMAVVHSALAIVSFCKGGDWVDSTNYASVFVLLGCVATLLT